MCASYIDNNGGLWQFDRALIDRNLLARFDEVLDLHVNGLAKVCERLFVGVPPGVTTLKRRAEAVPGIAPILEFVRLNDDFKYRISSEPHSPGFSLKRRPWWIIS